MIMAAVNLKQNKINCIFNLSAMHAVHAPAQVAVELQARAWRSNL
jgi:hypothetical protein